MGRKAHMSQMSSTITEMRSAGPFNCARSGGGRWGAAAIAAYAAQPYSKAKAKAGTRSLKTADEQCRTAQNFSMVSSGE